MGGYNAARGLISRDIAKSFMIWIHGIELKKGSKETLFDVLANIFARRANIFGSSSIHLIARLANIVARFSIIFARFSISFAHLAKMYERAKLLTIN